MFVSWLLVILELGLQLILILLIFLIIFTFIFGLVVGSFLNVVICRLGTRKKIIDDRSACLHCGHKLSWQDLIPVLSFVLLKGKCRYCGKKISWQYPLVEIATGLLFLLIFNFKFLILNEFSISNFQKITETVFLLLIVGFLIIIFVYDLKHYLIPDKIIFPAIGLTFLYLLTRVLFAFVEPIHELALRQWLIMPLLAGLGASLFFLFLVLITRGKGMGIGDVKLAFLMGLLLSWPNILIALFIAFLSGGLIGIILVLAKKKKMKSMVPFGPFLVAGTIIALFFGSQIIDLYWKFLI